MDENQFIQTFGPGIGILIFGTLGIFKAIPIVYKNRSPRAAWHLADAIVDEYRARVDRFKVETERRRSEIELNRAESRLNHAVLERIPPATCNCTAGNTRRTGPQPKHPSSHGHRDPDEP